MPVGKFIGFISGKCLVKVLFDHNDTFCGPLGKPEQQEERS